MQTDNIKLVAIISRVKLGRKIAKQRKLLYFDKLKFTIKMSSMLGRKVGLEKKSVEDSSQAS